MTDTENINAAPLVVDDSEVGVVPKMSLPNNRRSPFNSRVETEDQNIDLTPNFVDDNVVVQKQKTRSFKPLADQ